MRSFPAVYGYSRNDDSRTPEITLHKSFIKSKVLRLALKTEVVCLQNANWELAPERESRIELLPSLWEPQVSLQFLRCDIVMWYCKVFITGALWVEEKDFQIYSGSL